MSLMGLSTYHHSQALETKLYANEQHVILKKMLSVRPVC